MALPGAGLASYRDIKGRALDWLANDRVPSMTLNVARASWLYAVHVSDRLVTHAAREWDPLANKNILYFAPDAVVALGYAGAAYLSRVPTDQWIAQKLIAREFPPGERVPAFQMGRLRAWLPLGQAMRMLVQELESAFGRSPQLRGTRFQLLATRWQWGRHKRPRPILFGIRKEPPGNEFKMWHAPRHFGALYRLNAAPEENLRLVDGAWAQSALGSVRSPDQAEALLVTIIRRVAEKTPYVGRDCMSIVLLPPRYRVVRIRYLSPEPPTAIELGAGWRLPVAFSPWVIAAAGVWAPSVLSGTHQIEAGWCRVVLEAPSPAGDIARGVFSSLSRRPFP